jgi:hypothetical protein
MMMMIGNGTPKSQSRTRGMRPLIEGLTGTGVFIGVTVRYLDGGGNLSEA